MYMQIYELVDKVDDIDRIESTKDARLNAGLIQISK